MSEALDLDAIKERAGLASPASWGACEETGSQIGSNEWAVERGCDCTRCMRYFKRHRDPCNRASCRLDTPALVAEVEALRTALREIIALDDRRREWIRAGNGNPEFGGQSENSRIAREALGEEHHDANNKAEDCTSTSVDESKATAAGTESLNGSAAGNTKEKT